MSSLPPPQYAAASRIYGAVLPGWLPADDAYRIAAYDVYETLWRNVPETYQLTLRGSEDNPIYVPSARAIIEACNRYLAVGFDYKLTGPLAEPQLLQARDTLDTLFRREEFWGKFTTQKRFGLIRGDAVWHVLADPEKPPGRRLSLIELHPGAYFPIEDEDNPDKLVGAHLVDQWAPDPKKPTEVRMRRQTYRKEENGRISSETTLWEIGAWDDRPSSGQALKKVGTLTPRFELPPEITSIPIYHIKNQREPGAGVTFGTSEVQGMERLIQALTQGVTDQELALALQGLGMYVTNSGPPTDSSGVETNWILGPGEVVEVKGEGTYFNRVNGITSIEPYLSHKAELWEWIKRATATPDIAMGAIDVQEAESGIALQLRLAPMLSKNAEKEQTLLSVYDHMFYDLTRGWLPAFEQINFPAELNILPVVGDALPVNRKAIIDEVVSLMSTDPPLISAEYGRRLLNQKLGMEFPEDAGLAIVTELADVSRARDSFSSRLLAESETGEGNE